MMGTIYDVILLYTWPGASIRALIVNIRVEVESALKEPI